MRWVTAALVGFVVGVLRVTWRVRVVGTFPRQASLIVFWHGQQVALLGLRRSLLLRVSILISRSRDGAFAAALARGFGLGVVRGSSSRGAVSGALSMLRRLRSGRTVALAVDGPRGPRECVRGRPARLARAAGGCPVVPVAAIASRAWSLSSWDRLCIPKPFSRVTIVFGTEASSDVQGRLKRLSSGAWRWFVPIFLCSVTLWGCDFERRQALDALQSDRAPVRARALHVLGKHKDADLAQRIVPFLADPSARVRQAALAALGAVGPQGFLPRVISRLGDRDLEVRLTAVRVLGDSGRTEVKHVLLPMLSDPSAIVRRSVTQALQALGMTRRQQNEAVAQGHLRERLRELGSLDDQLRANAAKELGLSGMPAAVAPLVARITDASPVVLKQVAKALGRLGGDRATAALQRLARSKERLPRVAAAWGAATACVPRLLVSLLSDAYAEVQRAVLEAARSCRCRLGAAAREIVCARLKVQTGNGPSAIDAARIAKDEGFDCVEEVERLREQAQRWQSVKRLPPEALHSLVTVFGILAAVGGARSGSLLLALARRVFETYRWHAERWISAADWAELDADHRHPRPARSKRPPDVKNRRKALQWLLERFPQRQSQNMEDPLLPPTLDADVVARIFRLLPPSHATRTWLAEVALEGPLELKIAALAALGEMEAPKDAPQQASPQPAMVEKAVEANLGSTYKPLRRAAALAVIQLPAGETMSLKLLEDKDFAVRAAAATVLGRLRSRKAVPSLLEALKREPQEALITALARIGDARASEALAELLQEDYGVGRQDERVLVIEALMAVGERSSARAIEQELLHPAWHIRLAAARALAVVGRQQSKPALEACLGDYYASVRVACQRALKKL